MKKSKFICLVLITAAFASCNRQEREEDGWYVDVNFNWPNYYNYRHWKRHRMSYVHLHNGYIGRGGFGHYGHGYGGHGGS